MSDERVFIGLGSNLADPQRHVAHAVKALTTTVDLLRCSSCYRTAPWGVIDQPSFVNAVAEVRTDLEPMELLRRLQALETTAGRRRERRWGPRVLDLDLLAWGERRLETPNLTLPHPRLAERAFVLVPWAEIAPEFLVPGHDRVARLLAVCDDAGSVVPLQEKLPCTAPVATLHR